ncbi:MAG: VirB3 family type IV secretion system protein [Rickettsiales bacterium]
MAKGTVEADLLFLAMTRPSVLFGVSYLPVICNFLLCMMYFVLSSDFRSFLAMPLVHLIFYGLTQKEPLFMELFMVRMQYCNKCKNRLFHHMTNSYSLM